MKITREDFEFEVCPLFDRCMNHVRALLREAHVSPVSTRPSSTDFTCHVACLLLWKHAACLLGAHCATARPPSVAGLI